VLLKAKETNLYQETSKTMKVKVQHFVIKLNNSKTREEKKER